MSFNPHPGIGGASPASYYKADDYLVNHFAHLHANADDSDAQAHQAQNGFAPSSPRTRPTLPLPPQLLPELPTTSETTPLLGTAPAQAPVIGYNASTHSPAGVEAPPTIVTSSSETKILIEYSLPILITHLLEYSLIAVTVFSVGRLGRLPLGAASLASLTANVTALSVIQGFCSALETLCPRAWTGDPRSMNVVAMRTALILAVLLLPQWVIFWNAERIFRFLRQDPEVAQLASSYLRVLSIGLPGYAGFECLRRWLQAQGLMFVPTLIVCFVAPINVFLNWWLVWRAPGALRLGFLGAPLATALSMDLMFILAVIYTALYVPPHPSLVGQRRPIFTRAILKDIHINIWLGVNGVVAVSSEWWSWEICGLVASYLGQTALATQSVLLTSASLTYQLPYSVAAAVAVRAGHLLGARMPQRARRSSITALWLAVFIGLFNSTIFLINKDRWGKLFTDDEEVIDMIGRVIPLLALFQVADGVSGVAGGVLRAANRAPIGAVINITSYYVIGIPVGLALTFSSRTHLGLVGLWIGLTVALASTATLAVAYISRLDWTSESERLEKVREEVERYYEQQDAEDGRRSQH